MSEKQIENYRLSGKILGMGAFSKVFTGMGLRGQKLAVKVIPRNYSKDTEIYFERQVNLLRKCKSPWIVDLVDVKKSKNHIYIFLEYCEGGNLGKYIENKHRLSEVQALKLFSQLIKGMDCMKKMNVVHRDLKPDNIMLKNGNLKIIDFGLARQCTPGLLIKTFAGSPSNMAPQILKGQPYSDKVDIYSAGTILYEMLYGVLPYQARHKEDLIKQIEGGLDTEQVDNIFQVSANIKKLLKSMLEPSPAKRIQLSELLDFMQTYERQQQVKMIEQYKNIAKQSNLYFGVFSSIVHPFMSKSLEKEDQYQNFDLKMCSRLIQEISCC